MIMRALTLAALCGCSLAMTACASNDRYGYSDNNRLERAGTGAAIGAAAGAGVGAVVDGVDPIEGAVAGAVAGGVIGAVTGNSGDRRWRRDDRGNCYYEDRDGRRVYDRGARC
jgi:phage tail tape-measure protein